MHHGRGRRVRRAGPPARAAARRLLYATGLVGVCQAGDLEAIAALADLIALAAHLRAEGHGDGDDGRLWLATRRHLAGPRNGALDRAKDALRAGDPAPLRALVPPDEQARRLLARHELLWRRGVRRVSFRDLRDWIDALRRAGELVEIDAPVDPHLEITEIADRTMKAGGPALLFRNVRGHAHAAADQPVRHRAAHVPGARRGAARRRRASGSPSVMDLQPPQGLVAKVRALGRLRVLAASPAKVVRERAVPGGLDRRARPRPAADPHLLARRRRAVHHPALASSAATRSRAGATSACTGSRSTRTARTALTLADPQGRRGPPARLGAGRMEVAIALGTDPATDLRGSAPLPQHIDEMIFAGFLRGEQRRDRAAAARSTSRCRRTPRSCSRATASAASCEPEGPFGDHTGFYTPVDRSRCCT